MAKRRREVDKCHGLQVVRSNVFGDREVRDYGTEDRRNRNEINHQSEQIDKTTRVRLFAAQRKHHPEYVHDGTVHITFVDNNDTDRTQH